jgi:TPR repeat protein
MLQSTFSSWRELADNYIEGRRFWSVRQTVEDSENLASCYSFLLSNENFSPLCRLPWKTSLLPAQRRDDGAAEFRMGRAQFYCLGDYSCDKPAGRRAGVGLFKEAAAKGNVDAMFLLGSCYLFGEGVEKDYREAQRWFRRAADLGDACAQYQIGKLYYWGQGVARDHNQAAFWAYQAVSNGAGPHAEAYIGWCYERGAGLPKNMTNAFVFYRAAADEGVAWSQTNLAEMYEKGNGVQKDIRLAAALYEKAARNGEDTGMCRWARYLESGEAGVTNRTEAVNWYRRSAAKGNKQAKKRLAALGEPEVAPQAPGS